MKLDEILLLKYPEQMANGLIILAEENNGKGIFIQRWNVPGIEKPNEADLLAEGDKYQSMYDCKLFEANVSLAIENLCNETAKQKKYSNCIYCASYANSTNKIWAQEAIAFIAWRDQIHELAIQMQNDVMDGKIKPPLIDDFIESLPKIVWPQ